MITETTILINSLENDLKTLENSINNSVSQQTFQQFVMQIKEKTEVIFKKIKEKNDQKN